MVRGFLKYPIFQIGALSWHTMKIGRVGAIFAATNFKIAPFKGAIIT